MNLDIDRLSANFAKFLFLQRPMINTAMRWLSWLRFAFKQSFFQEKFEKVFPAKRNGQRWTFETKTSALPEWNVHWDESRVFSAGLICHDKAAVFFQIHFETALSTQARRIWKQFIKARTAQMAINLVQSLKKQKTIFVKERDKATVCFGFFK